MRRQLFALLGVIALVGVALGPAAAASASGSATATDAPLAIGVTQDGGMTVTVTANGTAVENATVDVATVDTNATYAGTGTYATDANGSVGLPTPNETVAVSIAASADNHTAETTATLTAEAGENVSFGQQVSAFVHAMQETTNGTGIGAAVSSFVVVNNPGNAPSWAGSPGGPNATANASADVAGNGSIGGPPAFVLAMFGDENATGPGAQGPPAHAGGPDDGDAGNETDGEASDGDDAADGDEAAGDDADGQAANGEDAAAGNGSSGGNGQGPPDDAGPPDDRGQGPPGR